MNAYLGVNSGNTNTTGTNNLMLGAESGKWNSTGSFNTFIGSYAGFNETGSNKLYIENSAADKTGALIYGEFDNNYLRLNANIDAGGSLNFIGTGAKLYINNAEALWFNGTYWSWGFGGTYNYFADPVTIGNIASPGYMLYVQGSAYATGLWSSSDRRLKTNINELNFTAADLAQLHPVSFEWNKEEDKSIRFEDGTQVGIIAQDVEKVMPQLVKTDSRGYKAVDYTRLSVLLIKVVQDQQAAIDKLNGEVEHLRLLESEVTELKSLLQK
jgi:trimeric autotransporter adhesin